MSGVSDTRAARERMLAECKVFEDSGLTSRYPHDRELAADIRLVLAERDALVADLKEARKWANTMEHERDWERDVVQSELRADLETARAERDGLRHSETSWIATANYNRERCKAAEASVAGLTEALQRLGSDETWLSTPGVLDRSFSGLTAQAMKKFAREALAAVPVSHPPNEERFVPEGDETCGYIMDACMCQKRKGHDGLHQCAHGFMRSRAAVPREEPGA